MALRPSYRSFQNLYPNLSVTAPQVVDYHFIDRLDKEDKSSFEEKDVQGFFGFFKEPTQFSVMYDRDYVGTRIKVDAQKGVGLFLNIKDKLDISAATKSYHDFGQTVIHPQHVTIEVKQGREGILFSPDFEESEPDENGEIVTAIRGTIINAGTREPILKRDGLYFFMKLKPDKINVIKKDETDEPENL